MPGTLPEPFLGWFAARCWTPRAPESLAVPIASPDTDQMFGSLSAIVLDEVHALAGTKRGDQLALCVERPARLTPSVRRVGAVGNRRSPEAIRALTGAHWIISVADDAPPALSIMLPEGRLSWGGHNGAGGRTSDRCEVELHAREESRQRS